MFLGELNYPVVNLDGIGPAARRNLSTLGVVSVAQLLRHYPVRYEDRKNPVPLALSSADRPAVTLATVLRHDFVHWKRGMALKVIVSDETDQAAMLCYGRNFLGKKLIPGKRIHLSGPFGRKKGELQSGTFVFEEYVEGIEPKEFGRIFPVYSLSCKW